MMRAMTVPEAGAQFQLIETDVPEPGPGEIRLRVTACGVCHSDSITVEGIMPITYPRVPGHEVVGVVEAIGPEVRGWEVGMRAGVGWFGGACGYCRRCRRGKAFACENITAVTGVTRDGGYASHMVADVSAVAHVPDDLDLLASAPLLCAGITTFNALRNSGARAGDVVAVHGIGGLGHLAVQFAARQGYRTVALNRGRDKEQLARDLGAHDYIDTEDGDPAAALQALGGAQTILATLTNADAMNAVIGGLAPTGTFMVIGAVPALSVDSMDLLLKSAAVKGWYSGTAPDSEDTLEFSALNGVASMNETYPFDDAQAAYDRMMSGKARFRVVLSME